jgi:cyclopropane fatty-acyl-phospholipid synthase-like methyltransferase
MTDLNALKRMQRSRWEKRYAVDNPLWRGPPECDIPLPDDAIALELGCGDGKTLMGLIGSDRTVVALDFSRRAVQSCHRRLRSNSMFHGLISNVALLPFSDEAFDIVVAFHILEHLLDEDVSKTVAEIKRVLRSGGRAYVRTYSSEDMRFGAGKEVGEDTFVRGDGIVQRYFTMNELSDLFDAFEKESLEKRVTMKRYDGGPYRRVTLNGVFLRT